jgi:putative membrane protein
MMWGYGEGWGMPMFGWPLALIIIAAVAFYAFNRRNGGADASTPRATLDRRYADGEITKDQYDQMRRDLAA